MEIEAKRKARREAAEIEKRRREREIAEHGDRPNVLFRRLIDEFRRELLSTGMFLAVSVEGGDALAEDGTLPLTVRLTERKRRSVILGLEYESDIGFGTNLDWQHRNFLAREVRLGTRRPEGVAVLMAAMIWSGSGMGAPSRKVRSPLSV